MPKKLIFYICLFLFILGIFFILNAQVGITGAVIGASFSPIRSSAIGFSLIFIASIIFFLESSELDSDLEKKIDENKKTVIVNSIKNILKERIKEEYNKKVENGEWVELKAYRIAKADNQYNYPGGTSLCRYWGPKEYKGKSKTQLEKLFKKGDIGKTHEIVRGSDNYDIRSIGAGSSKKNIINMPKEGSNVLHRHWEINQTIEYIVRDKQKR